jgi:hypothetical protein
MSAGCRLVFTNIFDDRDITVGAGPGWRAALEVLEALLDGREVDWSVWERADALAPDYQRILTG